MTGVDPSVNLLFEQYVAIAERDAREDFAFANPPLWFRSNIEELERQHGPSTAIAQLATLLSETARDPESYPLGASSLR